MSESTEAALAAALKEHGLQIPPAAVERIDRYCHLLWDWNRRLNLTRHTDYATFVGRDLVDAVQLAEHLRRGESIIDVGTGGGLPGILLGILRPDLRLTLLDAVAKKVRAVEDMVARLELQATVRQDKLAPFLANSDRHYDTLVARAVGSLDKVLTWVAPHWDKFDRLLLVKGPRWVEERGKARHLGLLHDKQLRRLVSYRRAGNDQESAILEIRRKPTSPPNGPSRESQASPK